ncbi:MAG TPA: Co2+/Mg2+ efflux protein ApaG [Gammaproteobacteria bacterium]|nr:Co2+/Mg2+ efflux protein ApaG [Gammaproteobacteria bacterium]
MKKITMHIHAQPTYLSAQSAHIENFLWSYEITISNESEDEVVQLLNRHWRITDMMGHIEEVRGPGVVGLQPIIKPGKKFVYNSLCQLVTPQGTMEGSYEFQTLEEVMFTVPIPKLVLTSPDDVAVAFRSRLH